MARDAASSDADARAATLVQDADLGGSSPTGWTASGDAMPYTAV